MNEKRILVACREADDMLKPLRKQLKSMASESRVEVDFEHDVASAVDRIYRHDYSYLVVGLALAETDGARVLDDGGFRFCRAAREHTDAPIACVVPDSPNRYAVAAQSIPSPRPLVLQFDEWLADTITSLVRGASMNEVPRQLDIMIFARAAQWRYEISGSGFDWETRRGDLALGKALLIACNGLAKSLDGQTPEWHSLFGQLGQALMTGLCEGNQAFAEQMESGLLAAGGMDRARVTFLVDQPHYRLPLEAIWLPEGVYASRKLSPPWMVHSPLVRHVGDGSGFVPGIDPFQGTRRPLRCLLVCANTSGAVINLKTLNGESVHLDPLAHPAEEVSGIMRLIERRTRVSFRDSGSLAIGVDKPVTPQDLEDALKRGSSPGNRWDVIHFAGHSHHDYQSENEQRAHLFVGEPGRPQAVPIQDVSPYMKHAKLVYMSSCDSGNAAFAEKIVQDGVPAVLGFRWRVPDGSARMHSTYFYHQLLKRMPLEQAFMRTRRFMHRRWCDDRAWASSMLVMGRPS